MMIQSELIEWTDGTKLTRLHIYNILRSIRMLLSLYEHSLCAKMIWRDCIFLEKSLTDVYNSIVESEDAINWIRMF